MFGFLRLLLVRVVDSAGGNIKALVDMLRDWLNLRAQLILNTVEVEPVLVSHEVDSETKMSETSRSANTVKIRL